MNLPKKSVDVRHKYNNLQVFFAIVLLGYLVYLSQHIVLPFIFSIILAILISPAVSYLERKKWNRIIAISFVVLISVILFAGLVFFVLSQMSMFGDALPTLREKFNLMMKECVKWSSEALHTSSYKVNTWVDKQTKEGMSNTGGMIGHTLSTMIRVTVNILLIPVYVFLLLVYKQLILTFISKVFPYDSHETVVEVLDESKIMIQSYLVGLMIEAAIVAGLNSACLLVLGVDYAIMLGIICALLNLIPYIGGIIAALLTTMFAIVTKTPATALLVLVANLLVQVIDNNFIVPKVVGSKVKINALASILVVLVGGQLYGIPGMFLSIPVTAILKVICDRIETLKPLGLLLGDSMPTLGETVFNIRKREPAPPPKADPNAGQR